MTSNPPRDDRESLRELVADLEDRVADLEARVEDQAARIEDQQATLEDQQAQLERKDDRIEALERDRDRVERRLEALSRKADATTDRVAELQTRELEKGAHLRADHVDEHDTPVPGGRLERLTKDDGETYYRLPESADPLEGDATTTLAYGDLLPIQQLARMDEDMRRSAANTVPTRLAAKLWQARTDPAVGDDPWQEGCREIDEYVTASDLKHWIRRQETGISESYAKKLVSRTIDALLDLSKHRVAVRKRTQRKNGLEYTERRLVLPTDAAIPG